MELPDYTVYLETPRMLFPKTVITIIGGLLAYIIIWLIFYMTKNAVPLFFSIFVMIAILGAVLAITVLNYKKISNYQYRFYNNRIEYYGEFKGYIFYNQITNLSVEKNFIDKLFHTGKINLGNFMIKNIPNLNQVFFYVQKMVQMYQQPQYGQYNPKQQYYQQQQANQQRQQQYYQQQQNQNNQYYQ